jgi:hypothetical protein
MAQAADTDPAVLDALWSEIEPTVFITRETWDRGLAGWDITAHRAADGRLAFVVLTKGPEIHYKSFGVEPMSLAMFRRWGQPLLDKYGHVVTRTSKDDRRQQRVNRRMGAVVTGEDEFFITFKWDH